MKIFMKRSFAVLMSLVMCASMFFGLSFPALAETENTVEYRYDGNYVYNWGTREEKAAFLSPMASKFYSSNETSLNLLLSYSGAKAETDVKNSDLYTTLKTLMSSNHKTITSYDDTKSLFQYTDCENNGDPETISSFYSGIAIGPSWDDQEPSWSREHTWPNSKAPSGDHENDIMMLRPTSQSENSSRGNSAYGETDGYYDPKNITYKDSNENTLTSPYNLRGDVARIMLYQYVRWGLTNTGDGYNPDGIFGEKGIFESKEVLLDWIVEDPVDTWEMGRNDAVQRITGTRNVFVDCPELAFKLFDTTLPTEFSTPSGETSVEVDSNGNVVTIVDATITFDDTAKRTSVSTEQQVWEENGIKFTNDKASSSTSVNENYYNPIRIYKNSQVTIEYEYPITKLDFTASSTSYTDELQTSLSTYGEVTVSDKVVTVVLTEPASTFTFTHSAAVAHVSSITIYADTSLGGDNGDDNGTDDSGNSGEDGGNTGGQTTPYYEKITTAPDDWSGDYLIVYEDGNVAFNGTLTTLDVVSNTVAVEIADEKIEATDAMNAAKFTIEKSGTNYTVKAASGKYIGNNSNSNALTSSDSALNNTLSLNSDASVNIICSGGAYLRFNAASNQNRFRYYKSSSYTNQKAIALYKYIESNSGGEEGGDQGGEETTYTLTSATANNANYGVVTFAGDSSAYTITANPINSGYKVVGYEVLDSTSTANNSVATVDDNGDGTYTVTELKDDISIVINFALKNADIGGRFVKVGGELADWSGEYLIVCDTKNVAFNGELDTLDAKNNNFAIEEYKNDKTINANSATYAARFIVKKLEDGTYTVQDAINERYVYKTANSNGLDANNTYKNTYYNTVTIDSDGNVNIIGSGGAYLRFNDDSDEMRFRYYVSYTNQEPISLYKYVESFDTENTITATPNNADMGSVSVIGNLIYATANDGYVVSNATVTSGNAAIEQNGSEFTVTAMSDATVQVNFERRKNTVTFKENGKVISEVEIFTGDYVSLPTQIGTTGKQEFEGWSLNGEIISETEYLVETDLVFVAVYKDIESGTAEPTETTATITFDNVSKRTEFSTSKQVWEENGITVTNNKSASTSNVGDYHNPARFYASSNLIVEYSGGNIKKIEFDANTASYATALKNSIGTVSGAKVTVSSDKVTVTFDSAVESFTIAKITAQVRVDSIDVTFTSGGDANPNGKINGAQVEVGKDLSLNFYVNMINEYAIPEGQALAMLVTMESFGTEKIEFTVGSGVYIFTYNNITPQCMADTISAQLVLIDSETGETVKEFDSIEEYSIRKNAFNLLKAYPEDKKLHQFIVDMLYYGEAAQAHRGHNYENSEMRATYGLSEFTDLSPSSNYPTAEDIENAPDKRVLTQPSGDVYFKSATVWFDSVNKLIVKLNTSIADSENLKLRVNDVVQDISTNFDGTVYTTDGIKATDFDTVYVFELLDGETVIQTLHYSINAYTYSKYNSSDETLANLAKTLYYFGVSADAYVSKD